MKKYDVTLTGHYEKTISVYADSTEQAAEKVKTILFDTDLIEFSDEVRTSAPYAKNVCMRTSVKNKSYQALNLIIHLAMERKFAC